MAGQQSSFEIRNLAPELAGTAEAVVLIDGRDQLARMGRSPTQSKTWTGFHPDDVLGPNSKLLCRDEPHDAFVAICSCGFLECGGLLARISRRDDFVVWSDFRDGSEGRSQERPISAEPFVFDREEYRNAVLGLGGPRSKWEPTTRLAALLARERLAVSEKNAHRIKFAGFDHVDDSRIQMVMFHGVAGDQDRALLTVVVPMAEGESADDLATRCVEMVTSGAVLTDSRTVRRDISRDSK